MRTTKNTSAREQEGAAIPWHLLTRLENKPDVFDEDAEFRMGWGLLGRHGSRFRQQFLQDFGIVVLKTEAFAAGNVEEALAFIGKNGFRVAYSRVFDMDTVHIASAWRYQFNRATPCRLRLLTDILSRRPVLALLVERPAEARQPCAVQLSKLKGTTYPELREPGTLRGMFHSPNLFLNYVHCCDQPADGVRELPIWFDSNGIADRLRDLAKGDPPSHRVPMETISRISRSYGDAPQDPAVAREHLKEILQAADGNHGEFIELMDAAASEDGDPLVAGQFLDYLGANDISLPKWEVYLFLSQYVDLFDGIC